MKFDRRAPGGGLEIETILQNGKVLFHCLCYLESVEENRESYLDLRIWDRENRLVFRACHFLWQEEPIRGMILHPHLWQGPEDAYLYRVQAVLMTGESVPEDLLEKQLAFRRLCEVPMKGWFLNDTPIEIRAVEYEPSNSKDALEKEGARDCEKHLRRDLQLIRGMGANGIVLGESSKDRERIALLKSICDELGLILWQMGGEKMPYFRQLTQNGFFTDFYYYHRACWSKEPFVYISRESLSLASDGTLRVTVYSNQPKVALYVEGELFEFRREGPDFVFEGIPVKQLPILLTAETGACSMSLAEHSVHKMFTI